MRLPFKNTGTRAIAILESEHSDLCVPITICALHNYLMENLPSNNHYTDNIDLDQETNGGENDADSFFPLNPDNNENIENDAKQIRNKFMQYFMSNGQVPWQFSYI